MFQLKFMRRQTVRVAAQEGALRPNGALVARIMAHLAGDLAKAPRLAGAVEAAVRAWVAAEQSFARGDDGDEEAFCRFAAGVVRVILAALPQEPDGGVLHLKVPLISRLPAVEVVHELVTRLIKRHGDGERRLGGKTADRVVKNLCRVSKVTEADARLKPHRIKFPRQIEAADSDLVEHYLGGTALGRLLLADVAITITDRARLSHGVCVAGSGFGKSQLLGAIVTAELARPPQDAKGLLILDSQTDLVEKIKRLKAFADRSGAGQSRLLLVDASDSAGLALNLFDTGRLDGLAPAEREQALMARIELTEYVLAGLFGGDMTSRQATLFRYLIQLMLSMPGANIETLRRCLEAPEDFRDDIDKLDGLARDYLSNQFMSKGFNPVRKQVVQRLYAVLQSPAFARMFAAKENKLDIGAALDAGRVVVVNTSKQTLGDQSRVFGRFVISLVMRAAFDRARLSEAKRRAAYVLIDEASDYFSDDDKTLQVLLEQGRKYGVGVMLFLQSISQMSPALRASVLSNCGIKLAGGVSAKDAKLLAEDMQCSPEFILSQRKEADGTNFATYVRNLTPRATGWRVPFFGLERLPQMSESDLTAVLARNRAELSG